MRILNYYSIIGLLSYWLFIAPVPNEPKLKLYHRENGKVVFYSDSTYLFNFPNEDIIIDFDELYKKQYFFTKIEIKGYPTWDDHYNEESGKKSGCISFTQNVSPKEQGGPLVLDYKPKYKNKNLYDFNILVFYQKEHSDNRYVHPIRLTFRNSSNSPLIR